MGTRLRDVLLKHQPEALTALHVAESALKLLPQCLVIYLFYQVVNPSHVYL
jgi:hypothetical protein